MGTDIHVTIEHQDSNGHWWTVFSEATYWTPWWTETIRGIPYTNRHQHPAYWERDAVAEVWKRDYHLFAALSNLRGSNHLHTHLHLPLNAGLCQQHGALHQWPENTSRAAYTFYMEGGYHHHGWCGWDDLMRWADTLQRLEDRLDTEENKQKNSLLSWIAHLAHILTLVFGDGEQHARLDRPFTFFGTSEERDGTVIDHFGPQEGASAHALLAYLEDRSKLTRWQDIPPERLRVLVCYDN